MQQNGRSPGNENGICVVGLALSFLRVYVARRKRPARRRRAFGTAVVEVGGGKQAAAIGMLSISRCRPGQRPQGAPVQRSGAVACARGGAATPASGLTGAEGNSLPPSFWAGSSGRYRSSHRRATRMARRSNFRLEEVALGYQEIQGRELSQLYCARCHDRDSTPERVSNHDNLTQGPRIHEGTVLNAMSEATLFPSFHTRSGAEPLARNAALRLFLGKAEIAA